ncbi:MAG: integrase core domain-containing protein [Pseudomonadota bacterium]
MLDFSRPGKPTDNSFVKTVNSNVQAERVVQNWFLSQADARLNCEAY